MCWEEIDEHRWGIAMKKLRCIPTEFCMFTEDGNCDILNTMMWISSSVLQWSFQYLIKRIGVCPISQNATHTNRCIWLYTCSSIRYHCDIFIELLPHIACKDFQIQSCMISLIIWILWSLTFASPKIMGRLEGRRRERLEEIRWNNMAKQCI